MALGDLVISLSMNTASFESDCGKAQQMADKVMTSIVRTSEQGELAMKKLAEAAYGIGAALDSAGPASDRLKQAFATLNIKSAFEIEGQERKLIEAFELIKISGVATATEIQNAFISMTSKIEMLTKMTGSTNPNQILGNNLAGSSFATELEAKMKMIVAEQSVYAAEMLKTEASAAQLVGQLQAGSEFTRQLKMQMEGTAAAAAKIAEMQALRSREQAGYAAQAMQGEASAARLVGQLQAGNGFSAQLKAQMEGTALAAKEAGKGMFSFNAFSLSAIANLAKLQIIYGVINKIITSITEIPGHVIEAITEFQTSIVKNAAIITSMADDVKDVGVAYQMNKIYAEGVQNALIQMSMTTIASGKQVNLVNDAFVLQGVYLDTNNKKQLEGFRNITQAVSTMTASFSNPDQEMGIQIRELMTGVNRQNALLYKTLLAQDDKLKEHIEDWQRIARETGNAGYVLEKLGPMLKGFNADTEDVSVLWTTVKNNLDTMTNMILRNGFGPMLKDMVAGMQEINTFLIQHEALISGGILTAWKAIVGLVNGMKYMLESLPFVAMGEGLLSIAEKVKNVFGAANGENMSMQASHTPGQVYAPPPPKKNVDEQNKEQKAADDAYLAYEKSFEEEFLTEMKGWYARQAEINSENYEWGLTDLKSYLDKKHQLNIDELEQDLATKQEELANAQKVMAETEAMYAKGAIAGGSSKAGASDIKEQSVYQEYKKVEDAIKAVTVAENALGLGRLKNANEDKKQTNDLLASYSAIEAKYLESQGQYEAAGKVQQATYEKSEAYLKLVANAMTGDKAYMDAYWADEANHQNESLAKKEKELVALTTQKNIMIGLEKEMLIARGYTSDEAENMTKMDVMLNDIKALENAISTATGENKKNLQAQLDAKLKILPLVREETALEKEIKALKRDQSLINNYIKVAEALNVSGLQVDKDRLQQSVLNAAVLAKTGEWDDMIAIANEKNDTYTSNITTAMKEGLVQLVAEANATGIISTKLADILGITASVVQATDQQVTTEGNVGTAVDGVIEKKQKELNLQNEITNSINQGIAALGSGQVVGGMTMQQSEDFASGGFGGNGLIGSAYEKEHMMKYGTSYYTDKNGQHWGNFMPNAPGYADGTDFVPETGLALIHKGERIIPASQNTPGSSTSNSAVHIHGGMNISLPNITKPADYDAMAVGIYAALQRQTRRHSSHA